MNWKGKLDDGLAVLETAKREVIQYLTKRIESLPENRRIKVLGARCFTIRSSDLGGNWTAGYHMFKIQYELILERLKSATNIRVALDKIIKDGFIKRSSAIYDRVTLHPDVIAELKSL